MSRKPQHSQLVEKSSYWHPVTEHHQPNTVPLHTPLAVTTTLAFTFLICLLQAAQKSHGFSHSSKTRTATKAAWTQIKDAACFKKSKTTVMLWKDLTASVSEFPYYCEVGISTLAGNSRQDQRVLWKQQDR